VPALLKAEHSCEFIHRAQELRCAGGCAVEAALEPKVGSTLGFGLNVANHEAPLPWLRELLAENGVCASVDLRRITNDEAAQRERFLGSQGTHRSRDLDFHGAGLCVARVSPSHRFSAYMRFDSLGAAALHACRGL
jgi:hypothetical protein